MKKTILLFLSAGIALASSLGIVQKVDGIVKVKHKDSIRKSKVKSGYEIQSGDILSTFRHSHAVLKLADRSSVVLDERSVIAFETPLGWKQQGGKIYYKITSKDVRNKLKIKTPFAIIGIKGTTFIVAANEKKSYVALDEGLIGIASIKEEFRLYKKRVMAEYENYVKKQRREFEKFKKEQDGYIVTTTKEFDLHAGNVVSFSGKKAVEEPLVNREEFRIFKDLLQE